MKSVDHFVSGWTRQKTLVLAIAVLIVHASLLFVVIPTFSGKLAPAYNQDRFADGYNDIASNLAAGNGYRFYPDTAKTLMREPGYPILLAGLFIMFGTSFTAVKVANMILALGTAWLMTRLARKISSNPIVKFAPAILFLLYPGTVVAESRGGVEMLFTLLITAFLLTAYNAIEQNRWQAFVLSGFVLGVTVLVRSIPILFPVFLLGFLLIFERRRMSLLAACRNVAVMIATMVAVLFPWIIRNYRLTGAFVPTASVLGISAHAGQYIDTHLGEGRPWWLLDREAARERRQLATDLGYPFRDGYYQNFYNSADEVKFSKFLFAKVVAQYKQQPMQFAKCVAYNLLNFWFAGKTWTATLANIFVQLPYLILGAVGAGFGVRAGKKLVGLIVVFIAYTVAIYVPILAQARYSVPLIPFVSILAAFALAEIAVSLTGKASVPTVQHTDPELAMAVGQGREL